MAHERLTRLGARRLGKRLRGLQQALKRTEQLVPLSNDYREILLEFGGAIWFDNGARYKPDSPNPLTAKNGYNNFEILYGVGAGENGIEQKASQYADELPATFVPIGESSGGNLICLSRDGSVYLWDHESPRTEGMWRIAASMDDFFKRLEPDDSETDDADGVIESESYLDF